MRFRIIISLFLVSSSLSAQEFPLKCNTPDGFPASTALVEFAALDAWKVCDMRCSGQPGPFHIMLMGDSVGALLAASPSPIAWQIDGVKSKSWDNFLNNPPPTGAKNWRVLNTAVSASTAHTWRSYVEKCLGDHKSENAGRWRATAPGRVWMEIGGNDIRYSHIVSVNPRYNRGALCE